MSGYVKKKIPKMSYSKLNNYDQCHWKFYLTYKLGNFFFADNLASDYGTLVHFFEQKIFETLKKGEKVDYEKIKTEFKTINIPKKDRFDTEGGIYGTDILKEKYKKEFYETNDLGQSFYSRTLEYLSTGMYRMEDYLKNNPDLVPYEAEKYFSITFENYNFSGHIDRIFYNKATDEYIIEDIKTKLKPFKDQELTTPLQLVIYCMGLHEMLDIPYEKMSCSYDLPFLNMRQNAGTKGFINRGIKKIEKTLKDIDAEDWEPSPAPLCYYCPYCNQNPDQPEGAENLCPYYSLWTPDEKTHAKVFEWKGMDSHEAILNKFLDKYGKNIKIKKVVDDFDFEF